MKKVAIIGYGYVGKAMFNLFLDHYQMSVYDKETSISTPCRADQQEINKCDLAIVCVPTPRGEEGECDISALHETFKWLRVKNVVIKSTVEVGTTHRLQNLYPRHNIVFSPEYAGESSYWSSYKFHTDVKEMPYFIFGGQDPSPIIDFYLPVLGPEKEYIITDSKSAEMAKYMENCFYATKVAFCNEMYDICSASNVDYNVVRELWLKDPRINRMHTAVFKDKRGFGGKCLPKDLSALITSAEKSGKSATILKAVQQANKDWGQ